MERKLFLMVPIIRKLFKSSVWFGRFSVVEAIAANVSRLQNGHNDDIIRMHVFFLTSFSVRAIVGVVIQA